MIYLILVISCLCVLLLFLNIRRDKGVEKAAEIPVTPVEEVRDDHIAEEASTDDKNEKIDKDVQEDKDYDKFVVQNKQLVADLHRVLEVDEVFLRPDIHIDDVARMLLTNRTYVTRMMRHEYGLTFIEYVNVARIQYSQKLLYSSGMTLDEVAEKSGFQSTSNYCRAFKRYIGTSPMSWLQTVK